MQSEYGLAPVQLSEDGPGRSYARHAPAPLIVMAVLSHVFIAHDVLPCWAEHRSA